MSTPFQNRLVGTVIVAALAIIFLPDILDGDKKSYQEEFASIPKAPIVDIQSDEKAFPEDKLVTLPQETLQDESAVDDDSSQAMADSEVADDNTATSKISTTNDGVVKVATLEKESDFSDVTDSQSKPRQLPEKATPKEAWEIQLGSFRHKKNVDELVAKLRANGYTVFTKPIRTKSGQLTKVIVGPEFSKVSLEKQIPKLKALTGVQGKISKFTPTK